MTNVAAWPDWWATPTLGVFERGEGQECRMTIAS